MSFNLRFDNQQNSVDHASDLQFSRLIQLLASTRLEVLKFWSINSIPMLLPTSVELKLSSLKVLKLSGGCSFKKPVSPKASRCRRRKLILDIRFQEEFLAFSALLQCFPSLKQLHLCGSFFGGADAPDDLSKLSLANLHFGYPELGSLLSYLRQSRVEIFTCSGLSEIREVRWTRASEEEEFVRDCWTLERNDSGI